MTHRVAVLTSQLTPPEELRRRKRRDIIFQVSPDGEVAVFCMDVPPLNTLGDKNRQDISSALDRYEGDPRLRVLVITGRGKNFCCGADISEFASMADRAAAAAASKHTTTSGIVSHGTEGRREEKSEEDVDLYSVLLNRIEQCKKPVVAAVNGLALGGGCVLALACHYRVVSASDSVFGLPEVKLGIIPAWGGTQRLTRCIGVQNSIAMCCGGINVKAEKAMKWGLCDFVSQGGSQVQLVQEAILLGLQVYQSKASTGATNIIRSKPTELQLRRLCDDTSKLPRNPLMRGLIFYQARKQLREKVPKGFPSPWACLEAIEHACTADTFEQGLKAEATIAARCIVHPSAQALRHLFFAERVSTRIPPLEELPVSLPVSSEK